MGVPWTTTTKTVTCSGTTTHAYTGSAPLPAFSPPALISAISSTPPALFAAMAKMQALKVASPVLVSAVERAAKELTEAVVDDTGTDFDLAREAELLEITARTSLAGAVGVGMCHLYMDSLGYVWNDFAASSVPKKSPRDPLADFVYDGGWASGHGVVLAEAKGSFSAGVTSAIAMGIANRAYLRQVDRYIAASTSGAPPQPIVHGYAIAFGAQLASVRAGAGPHAFIHVAETDRPPLAPAGVTPSNAGATVPAVTSLALGNYRADFVLARAPRIVEMIDALRTGTAAHLGRIQEFTRIRTHAGTFITGRLEEHAYSVTPPWTVYAVEETTARGFLAQLSALAMLPTLPAQIDLLTFEPDIDSEPGAFDDDFVFRDGLTMIGSRTNAVFAEKLDWSALYGLVG